MNLRRIQVFFLTNNLSELDSRVKISERMFNFSSRISNDDSPCKAGGAVSRLHGDGRDSSCISCRNETASEVRQFVLN